MCVVGRQAGRTHRWPSLFSADPAIFPSSPSATPRQTLAEVSWLLRWHCPCRTVCRLQHAPHFDSVDPHSLFIVPRYHRQRPARAFGPTTSDITLWQPAPTAPPVALWLFAVTLCRFSQLIKFY